jgi:hypothetical protein
MNYRIYENQEPYYFFIRYSRWGWFWSYERTYDGYTKRFDSVEEASLHIEEMERRPKPPKLVKEYGYLDFAE